MSDDKLTRSTSPWFDYQDDNRGTSTSDEEAPLRDIGAQAFGISYPKDITPRKGLRRLPAPKS